MNSEVIILLPESEDQLNDQTGQNKNTSKQRKQSKNTNNNGGILSNIISNDINFQFGTLGSDEEEAQQVKKLNCRINQLEFISSNPLNCSTESDSNHSECDQSCKKQKPYQLIKSQNQDIQLRSYEKNIQYLIDKKIGNGCSSTVYLAQMLDQNNQVIDNSFIAVKKFKERKVLHFEREKKILSMVNDKHPNIVRIQSINVQDMEILTDYYPKGDMLDFVIKKGVLKESQARFFFKGICNALLYLKKNNICHRDLKLENILLDNQLNPILIDFAFSDFNKTNFTDFIGTDGYQSPENVLKQPYCGHQQDIFSMGVMLFEMIMGKPPFQAAKIGSGLYKKFIEANNEYWDAFKKFCDPSKQAKDLINRLLDSNPNNRITIEEVFKHPWMHESQLLEQIKV